MHIRSLLAVAAMMLLVGVARAETVTYSAPTATHVDTHISYIGRHPTFLRAAGCTGMQVVAILHACKPGSDGGCKSHDEIRGCFAPTAQLNIIYSTLIAAYVAVYGS